jgi:hypothetical protein
MVAKAVLIMSAIILVLFVGLIFWRKRQERKEAKWPPVISKCPDYFVHQGDNKCLNTFQLNGSCPNNACDYCEALGKPGPIDFLKGKNPENEKDREALCQMIGKCGLTWEGISEKCAV